METDSLDRLRAQRARLEKFKSRVGIPAINLIQGKMIGLGLFGGPHIIEPDEPYEPMQYQLNAVQQYIDNTSNKIRQQKGTNKA